MNPTYEQEKQKRKLGANKTYAYYTIFNAREVQPVVDEMINDGLPRVFKAGSGCSLETLKIKLHRSILYLVDCMDDQSKRYYRWRNTVKICVDKKARTIILMQKPDLHTPISGVSISDVYTKPGRVRANNVDWQTPFENWLEEGETGSLFTADELTLSDEDIMYVRSSLVGLETAIRIQKLTTNEIEIKRLL